jgi:hypothetical protein
LKRKVQCAICGRTATVEIDDEAKEIKSELRVTGDGGLLGEVKLTNGVVAEYWERPKCLIEGSPLNG